MSTSNIAGLKSSGCLRNLEPDNVKDLWKDCKDYDEGQPLQITNQKKAKIYDASGTKLGECDKLLSFKDILSKVKKNLYNQWLTTIILGIFISILDIGLTIFGFLLLFDSNSK